MKIFPILKRHFLEMFLVMILLVYYSHFVNKGLVIYDEGYTLAVSTLIVEGSKPFKDFFLQYTPLFFYLMAFVFKIFGQSVISGRILVLLLYISIAILYLQIFRLVGIKNLKLKVFSFFVLAAFGLPLNNIPTPITLIVPLVILNTLLFIKWIKQKDGSQHFYIFTIGLVTGLLLMTKQNIGLAYTLVLPILILNERREKITSGVKGLIYFFLPILLMVVFYFYFFFIKENLQSEILYFLTYGNRIIKIFPPSYPFIETLMTPGGPLKLLPYYLPIFLLMLFFYIFIKGKNKYILPLLLPFTGLFANLYPQSDLLHLYPFLGPSLVSSLLIVEINKKMPYKRFLLLTILVTAMLGYYLTFFREYYRYLPHLASQTEEINLIKAKFIKTDPVTANGLNNLEKFVKVNVAEKDTIFVYPHLPIVYFLLDKKPPTKYLIHWPGYLTSEEEEAEIVAIQNSETRFLLSQEKPHFNTPLADWISQQELTAQFGYFYLYKVNN